MINRRDKSRAPRQNRCSKCNKLLGVGDPGDIVIKCPRCNSLNQFRLKEIVERKNLKTNAVDIT